MYSPKCIQCLHLFSNISCELDGGGGGSKERKTQSIPHGTEKCNVSKFKQTICKIHYAHYTQIYHQIFRI